MLNNKGWSEEEIHKRINNLIAAKLILIQEGYTEAARGMQIAIQLLEYDEKTHEVDDTLSLSCDS